RDLLIEARVEREPDLTHPAATDATAETPLAGDHQLRHESFEAHSAPQTLTYAGPKRKDRSKMRRAVFLLGLATAVLGLGFVRGRRDTSSAVSKSAFRVGLVFDVGGRGDKSFNDLSWAGLQRGEKE